MSDIVNIPGRDIVALLRSEAKRKPAIAELMERAADMTDAEIDVLKVPFPWYRKALKAVRSNQINAASMVRVKELVDQFTVDSRAPDPTGSMRRYTGDTQFITVSRGNMLEIKTGNLIWFPMSGGVWIDTVFSNVVDPVLAQSTYVKEVTKSGYATAEAERRCGSTGAATVPFTVVDGVTPPANARFTIFR